MQNKSNKPYRRRMQSNGVQLAEPRGQAQEKEGEKGTDLFF